MLDLAKTFGLLSLLAVSACGNSGDDGGGAQGPQGEPGPEGPAGPKGDTGAQGPAGPAGPQGAAGPQGPAGATGAAGAIGPMGPMGLMGTPGAMGPMGTPGAMGPMGPAGASGATGPAGAQGSMGPPGLNGEEVLHVMFAGYTAAASGGNLGGRTGAHARCNTEFPGSHFCTDWELDRSEPPPITTSAWVDRGTAQTTTRFFRPGYSTSDLDTCAGWTSSAANVRPDGANLGRGQVFTALGGFADSFVGANDGGCEVARVLACCIGGTGIRFRGFTAASDGNLGGRSGARAKCNAAFAGSHFCTDWEIDQAALHGPIPGSGAWVDRGDSAPSSRRYHGSYSTSDLNTCAGWTSAAANVRPDGANLGRGQIVTALGGIDDSFVGASDGGCEVSRPLACCDGTPPE